MIVANSLSIARAVIILVMTCHAFSVVAQDDITPSFYYEAECAEVGARWDVRPDSTASGGYYVTSQFASLSRSGTGDFHRIRFIVTPNVLRGEWSVNARVSVEDGDSDSYFVRINNGPWTQPALYARRGAGFHWIKLLRAELRTGADTIDIAYREPNTHLDKIQFTREKTLPTDIGPSNHVCGPDPYREEDKNIFWLEAECAEVGSAWKTVVDQTASNGAYVVPTQFTRRRERPFTVPKKYIRFTVNDPFDGAYRVWLRRKKNSGGFFFIRANNGEWMQYAAVNGTHGDYRWTYETSLQLQSGRKNTIDIMYSSGRIELDKILLTRYGVTPSQEGGIAESCELTPFPVPTAQNTFFLEAECAQVGSLWTTVEEENTGGGRAVVVRDTNSLDSPPFGRTQDVVRFTVNSAEPGNYSLYGRIKSPTGYSDSYWVRVNNGEWQKWWTRFEHAREYRWYEKPLGIQLVPGNNTVEFAFRESGTYLDKIYITSTSAPPTSDVHGIGGMAINCELPTEPRRFDSAPEASNRPIFQRASIPNLDIYPNPVTSSVNIRYSSPLEGKVSILIVAATGQVVTEYESYKSAGDLIDRIAIPSLPPGTYAMRLLQEGETITKTFVKK